MKISIIQFEPITGGETTLTVNLKRIILEMGHDIQVYHPCLKMMNRLVFPNHWQKVGNIIAYEDISNVCKKSDFTLFINSIHISPKTEEYSKMVFNILKKVKGCKLALYEHGLHTWDFCNYEKMYNILSYKNSVYILTNTVEAIEKYKERKIDAYLCRQPFFPEDYREIKRNESSRLQMCFNSRFSRQKGAHHIYHYFEEFLYDKTMNFDLNFRESAKNDELKNSILKTSNGKVLPKADRIEEVYDKQDYCIYYGYDDNKERGKMEYSLIEAFHFGIPVIAHPFWCIMLKQEYGVKHEDIVYMMDPYHIRDIIKNGEKLPSLPGTKIVLEEFLPEIISKRLQIVFDL